ncbi:MAG: hypothetical protein R3C49_10740 [Planctomycetaceae bacterium]
MTAGELLEWCGEYFKSTGVQLCGHDFVPDSSREDDEDQWMLESMLRENMGTYQPYESTDNVFDMTQMKRFAGDIACPKVDRTIIHRYIRFGEEDRWGKSRPRPISNDTWAADLLSHLPVVTAAEGDYEVGLDVRGPGGGQWTLSFSNGGECTVSVGLPNEPGQVLRMSLEEFLNFAETGTPSDPESRSEDVSESLINRLHDALTRSSQLTSAS